MRLIDADELMEHVWRDKLDSRELIAKMIDNAPTVKKIPTEIPINIFEQLILQQPKTGKWIGDKCSNCGNERAWYGNNPLFCPDCGARMDLEVRENGNK